MTDETELMPCPFCGVEPITKEWEVGGHTQIKIICNGDFCHVHPSVFGNKKAMVEAWNTRADLVPTYNLRQPSYLKQVPTRTAYGVGEILSDEDLHAITSTKMDTKYDYLNRELEEQARLNGMGAERELALMAKLDALRESHDRLLALLRETLSYVESEYTGHGGLDLTSTKVIARAKEAIAESEKLQEGKL